MDYKLFHCLDEVQALFFLNGKTPCGQLSMANSMWPALLSQLCSASSPLDSCKWPTLHGDNFLQVSQGRWRENHFQASSYCAFGFFSGELLLVYYIEGLGGIESHTPSSFLALSNKDGEKSAVPITATVLPYLHKAHSSTSTSVDTGAWQVARVSREAPCSLSSRAKASYSSPHLLCILPAR